jgi:hypothetical protein
VRWSCLLLVTGCFIKPTKPDVIDANIVFVSSSTLMLGGGVAQADATCNTLARDADPPLSGTYVAWLSTQPMNAIDRLGNARGWVRTDGKPFADLVDDIGSGNLFYPPRLDENGSDVGPTAVVGTGTMANGVDDNGEDCQNDANSDGSTIEVGLAGAGVDEWTAAATIPCNAMPLHIYCFAVDKKQPVGLPTPTGPFVFLSTGIVLPTSGSGSGMQEDAQCRNDALANSVTGTFVAAIADDSTSIDAKVGHPSKPWQRRDGVEVGNDFGALAAPIDVDGSGTYGGGYVFTGATGASTVGSGDCINWTSSQGNVGATVGDAAQTGSNAIDVSVGACDATTPVYCAQVE